MLARQVPGETAVHALVGITQAHDAGGVAVVSVAEREESVLAAHAEVAPVLHRHLHRDFHAHGARVGEEDVLEPGRRQRDEPVRQPLCRPVGQAAEHDVRELLELRAQGGVQLRVAIAVNDAPPARDGIDQHAPVGEVQPRANRAHHLVLDLEASHLRVGVPEGLG